MSIAFVIAVMFWMVTAVKRRRRPNFSTRAGIVMVMWTASIATAAGAHTLDVWRYLIPAVPMVGLMLSLLAVELAETIAALRRRHFATGPTRTATARNMPASGARHRAAGTSVILDHFPA